MQLGFDCAFSLTRNTGNLGDRLALEVLQDDRRAILQLELRQRPVEQAILFGRRRTGIGGWSRVFPVGATPKRRLSVFSTCEEARSKNLSRLRREPR